MTDTKHTPGPWRMNQEVPGAPIAISKPTEIGRGVFCRVLDIKDARLIAAAPELLAALERLRQTVVNVAPDDVLRIPSIGGALEDARAAIARARGES